MADAIADHVPSGLDELRTAVRFRAERRGLRVDMDRLAYANDVCYRLLRLPHRARILIVGIGHGHDALMALHKIPSITIVGVDPYRALDGNDDRDYRELNGLVERLHVQSRLQAVKSTIEVYLESNPPPFDAIICPDVLHHIFVTRTPLNRSDEFTSATALFRRLRDAGRTTA